MGRHDRPAAHDAAHDARLAARRATPCARGRVTAVRLTPAMPRRRSTNASSARRCCRHCSPRRTRAPVLLAIDDLPYLDTASASAVTFALRRMEGPRPARLLATVRDHDARLPVLQGLPSDRCSVISDRSVDARCAVRSAADPPRDPARAADAAARLRDVGRQSALRAGAGPRPRPPRDQPEGGYSTAGTGRTQRAGRCARSRPTGRQ